MFSFSHLYQGAGKKGIGDAELQKVIELSELAHEACQNACEAFFKEKMALANSAARIVENFEDRVEELVKEVRARVENIHVGTCLMTIIRDLCMIAECGKRIAEITINNSITEEGRLP